MSLLISSLHPALLACRRHLKEWGGLALALAAGRRTPRWLGSGSEIDSRRRQLLKQVLPDVFQRSLVVRIGRAVIPSLFHLMACLHNHKIKGSSLATLLLVKVKKKVLVGQNVKSI